MVPRRETLVLTIPADPGLAHLARLVSVHFFRQNGLKARDSRRAARIVEMRCRAFQRSVRSMGASVHRHSPLARRLRLTLLSHVQGFEVTGRRVGRPGTSRLLRFERPPQS